MDGESKNESRMFRVGYFVGIGSVFVSGVGSRIIFRDTPRARWGVVIMIGHLAKGVVF